MSINKELLHALQMILALNGSKEARAQAELAVARAAECQHIKGGRAFGDYYYCETCGEQIHSSGFAAEVDPRITAVLGGEIFNQFATSTPGRAGKPSCTDGKELAEGLKRCFRYVNDEGFIEVHKDFATKIIAALAADTGSPATIGG